MRGRARKRVSSRSPRAQAHSFLADPPVWRHGISSLREIFAPLQQRKYPGLRWSLADRCSFRRVSSPQNLFLAIQTFLVLVVRIQTPPWLKWIALTAGWLFPIVSRVDRTERVETKEGSAKVASNEIKLTLLFFPRPQQLMTALGPALNKSSFSFYGPTSAGCWLSEFSRVLALPLFCLRPRPHTTPSLFGQPSEARTTKLGFG
jgi:hypothetical protein